MHWIKIDKKHKPPFKGTFMCFVPDCKLYKKHHAEYDWDGKKFIDDTFIGRGKTVEATHFMIITDPEN